VAAKLNDFRDRRPIRMLGPSGPVLQDSLHSH